MGSAISRDIHSSVWEDREAPNISECSSPMTGTKRRPGFRHHYVGLMTFWEPGGAPTGGPGRQHSSLAGASVTGNDTSSRRWSDAARVPLSSTPPFQSLLAGPFQSPPSGSSPASSAEWVVSSASFQSSNLHLVCYSHSLPFFLRCCCLRFGGVVLS